jgi:hypothetical protein
MTDTGVARVQLDPKPSRGTVLDGGWWPHSTDLMVELPQLVAALSGRGEITHALLNSTDWDLPHERRLSAGRKGIRLGFYSSQPAGLITLMSDFGNDRFDLVVVPPSTGAVAAKSAMKSAADAKDGRRAPELLAAMKTSKTSKA